MPSKTFIVVDDVEQVLPPTSRKVYVALDENGRRVGETHHGAKLTDHEVELIRELREKDRMATAELAEKFECSKSTIKMICAYSRRATTPARWIAVIVHAAPSNTVVKSEKEISDLLERAQGIGNVAQKGLYQGRKGKLSSSDRLDIFCMFKDGHSKAEISRKHNVSWSVISDVLRAEKKDILSFKPAIYKKELEKM